MFLPRQLDASAFAEVAIHAKLDFVHRGKHCQVGALGRGFLDRHAFARLAAHDDAEAQRIIGPKRAR
jgi:hypothetical protein